MTTGTTDYDDMSPLNFQVSSPLLRQDNHLHCIPYLLRWTMEGSLINRSMQWCEASYGGIEGGGLFGRYDSRHH